MSFTFKSLVLFIKIVTKLLLLRPFDMYYIFIYIVHIGNTMGDCCEDKSDICIIKTNNLDGRKRR